MDALPIFGAAIECKMEEFLIGHYRLGSKRPIDKV
jgi:hypothetical protein